jgi:hypothetical protein
MNEVDCSNLPSVGKSRKGKKIKITTGTARSTTGTKYKGKGILKELSTAKRPPSK